MPKVHSVETTGPRPSESTGPRPSYCICVRSRAAGLGKTHTILLDLAVAYRIPKAHSSRDLWTLGILYIVNTARLRPTARMFSDLLHIFGFITYNGTKSPDH